MQTACSQTWRSACAHRHRRKRARGPGSVSLSHLRFSRAHSVWRERIWLQRVFNSTARASLHCAAVLR
eukprot:3740167-Rhodomonas_salina.2